MKLKKNFRRNPNNNQSYRRNPRRNSLFSMMQRFLIFLAMINIVKAEPSRYSEESNCLPVKTKDCGTKYCFAKMLDKERPGGHVLYEKLLISKRSFLIQWITFGEIMD